MKIKITPVLICFYLVGMLFHCSCDHHKETELERVNRMLTAAKWTINGVSEDGVDQTASYQKMTLTFTAGSYKVSDGGAIWPSQGAWKLNDDAKSFVREDGLVIQILKIGESDLSLSFYWPRTTFGPGRLKSIHGNYIFSFGKK